jgi:hypothetical protein
MAIVLRVTFRNSHFLKEPITQILAKPVTRC